MNNMPKMTEKDKAEFIALHKMMARMSHTSAMAALSQSLGKFLYEGACTPDDAADILKAAFDEEVDRKVDAMDISELFSML